MAGISSDESEEVVAKYKSNSTKKQRLASSSSSDGEHTLVPENEHTTKCFTETVATSRSSERIRQRRSKSFTMPSKQEVWDAIPSTKTPEKTYDALKPRKLVNNFTRVTHRYNHDPAYTSDEDSSLGGFLTEDGTESSSDSSDSDFLEENVLENQIRQRRKKHRIKNRRIVQVSSDSDSVPKQSDSQGDKVRSRLREKILSRCNSVDETVSGKNLDNEVSSVKDGLILGLKKAKELLASSSDDEKSKDNQPDDQPVIVRRPMRDKRGRKRKANADITSGVMGKSSDADDEECTSLSDRSVSKQVCEDVSVVNGCGESSASVSLVCDDNVERDSEGVAASKRRRRSALDSASESSSHTSEDDDEDEDNKNCLSRSVLQTQERKQKRENLFKDFKQARSKLKSKQTMK